MNGYIMIMIDEPNWGEFMFAPQYVVGIDNKFIPVFIGNGEEEDLIGIYVKAEDYHSIDHSQTYIFINNPDADNYETLKGVIDNVKDKLKSEESNNTIREHINIGLEFYEEPNENMVIN
ncbi:MAG: hypothetical protein ACOC2W_01215 [bacterium]